jgi:hypothetical protein
LIDGGMCVPAVLPWQLDPYREHVKKRTVFNNTDRILDADKDGRVDGLFCEVERHDSKGVAVRVTVTVDDA